MFKLAEAAWRKRLDKLEGQALYDAAHKMTSVNSYYGAQNLGDAYRYGITDKRVIKAIISDADKYEDADIANSYRNKPVKDLNSNEIRLRRELIERQRAARLIPSDSVVSYKEPKNWGHNLTPAISPETEVHIIHGGGERFINDVKDGKSQGYRLERGSEKGIQVHPYTDNYSPELLRRSTYHAQSKVGPYIDNPAIMRGTIKAKYLYEARNGYEAGLPAKNFKYIKNLEISKVAPSYYNYTEVLMPIIERIRKIKKV